jgi:NADPH-dependent glutamate synthase beta subunit-like oxidoreductase
MSERFVARKDLIIPPCMEACPAGVDVPRYIRAVKERRYDLALAVLREKLPFPVVCADACFAPCEDVCAYRQYGDPIAIRALKRTAVDKGGDLWKKNRKPAPKTGRKTAVIGAGPAGLTAAFYLAAKGHQVTVFDRFPRPGGTLRYGIPKYRIPESRLDKDIEEILAAGVKFKRRTVVGEDIKLGRLKKDFDAVFVASGAAASAKIPLNGSDKKGVLWGWDFLRDVGLGKKITLSGDVVVVGGGNVAVDVALTAKRVGAGDVHLYCLERREEMPAHDWEIARAEEEGVFIHNSWGPKKVLGERTATGLVFKRCLSVFDDRGNFEPIYDEEITDKRAAKTIILAVGQQADIGFLKRYKNVGVADGWIAVDGSTLSTGEKGVFAGGDVVRGPLSIIDAVAQGRKAAESIDRFLGGDGDIEEKLVPDEEGVTLSEFVKIPKPGYRMPLLGLKERRMSFEQVERGLNEEHAVAEAKRCLDCDARMFEVMVYAENCKECGYCNEVCELEVFAPTDMFNEKGYRPFEAKNPKFCVGCLKCFYACPDYAIDIREVVG